MYGFQEPLRNDRENSQGGVCVYFKNELPVVRRRDLELHTLKRTWCEMIAKNMKIWIGVFYRPPRNDTHFYPIRSMLANVNIDEELVKDCISLLRVPKASGPDNINPKLLKAWSDSICKPLCMIFNKQLESSIFPQKWKNANVNPLHQKESKQLTKHYRPISLLSCVSKIFERRVVKLIFNHCIYNKIITSFQSAYLLSLNYQKLMILCLKPWMRGKPSSLLFWTFLELSIVYGTKVYGKPKLQKFTEISVFLIQISVFLIDT